MSTPKTSAWKQAGIYGLEFAGAAVGTSVAAVGAAEMFAVGWNRPELWWVGLAAFPTYAVSSALLSAALTHLVGKMTGQSRPFTRALAGGAVGGLTGAGAVYLNFSDNVPDALMPAGLVLPPLGAVIAYNIR